MKNLIWILLLWITTEDFALSLTCDRSHTLPVVLELRYLTSPSHPEPYTHNLRCHYILVAPPGQQIELIFESVDTEEDFDKIRIYDGDDEERQELVDVLEGASATVHRYVSSMGKFVIVFKTDLDHQFEYTGFKATYRLVLLPRVKIVSDVRGCLAENYITSTVKNVDTVPREVIFSVLYPPSSFATGLNVIIEGISYQGQIISKANVSKTFSSKDIKRIAVSRGGNTRDIFKSMKIGFVVQPGDTIVFEFTYIELLERRLGRYSDRIILPRELLIGDVAYEVNICARADLTFIQVPTMTDTGHMSYIEQQERFNDTDHHAPEVSVVKHGTSARIRYTSLSSNRTTPLGLNHDEFLVHYDVKRSKSGIISMVDGEYFGHFYAPDNPVLIRRMVYLLDVSGSMAGEKIEQVKIAMTDLLGYLTETDYFNIVEMESVAKAWKRTGLVQATPRNIDSAQQFIQNIEPDGGTNTKEGLVTALRLLQQGVKNEPILRKLDVNPHRDYIIFLSDGRATVGEKSTTEILDTVSRINKRGYGIYGIGFGTDVDHEFLHKIVEDNNGKWKHVQATDRAHIDIHNFIVDIGVPIMTDINFSYLSNQVLDHTSLYHPVLLQGGELAVFGRYNVKEPKINVYIQSRTSQIYNKGFVLDIPDNTNLCGEISATSLTEKGYAILVVQDSLRELDENPTPQREQALRKLIMDLAVKHSFLTPFTTMIINNPIPEIIDLQYTRPIPKNDPTNEPTIDFPEGRRPMIIQGDPHFLIPLSTNVSICFTWAGEADTVYNLLHDPRLGFSINGLIEETPKMKEHTKLNQRKIKHRTYIVKLGVVFEKEDLYIELTPHNVSISSIQSNKRKRKVYDATDEDKFIMFGDVSVYISNITDIRSIVKIIYLKKIMFFVNLRRIGSSETQSHLSYIIDHLDLEIFGEEYIYENQHGFTGIFANVITSTMAPGSNGDCSAYVEYRHYRHFLHFKNKTIPVLPQTHFDPEHPNTPTQCWDIPAYHVIGEDHERFIVTSLSHGYNQHKNKQAVT